MNPFPPAMEESSLTSVIGSSGMSYRQVRELGEGGMARILLAYAVGSGGFTKLVVLKMLRRQLAANPTMRQMFQAEARLSARLNHPNLVQVYEVVEGDAPFLVMEYLDGKSLSAIGAGSAITTPMLLTVISEALIGLHHAHTLCDFDGSPLHIVHRDISPHNIFVTYDGAVKVLDFGIAKMVSPGSNTGVGDIQGKIAYMAPEQLLGEEIDRRADIFSVGCMLWEAAVGSRMWANLSEARVMHQLVAGIIPRPSERSSIEPELDRIIRRATAPAVEDRYPTALELHRDLVGYLGRARLACSMRDVGATLTAAFQGERESQKKALTTALRYPRHSSHAPAAVVTDTVAASASTSTPAQKRWPTIALAAILLLAGGGVALWRLRSPDRAAADPPPAAPLALVNINVRATPPETAIEIDGVPRGTEAVVLRAPPDARDHAVKASAPGYMPRIQSLKFDRDQDVEIFLEKLAPAPGSELNAAAGTARPRRAPRPAAAATKTTHDEGACNPGYYFVDGIKTYKPECL
jgi:serine/threonine protein kinase